MKKSQMADLASSAALPHPPSSRQAAVTQKSQIPDTPAAARYGDRIYSAITFLASLSIFVIILWLLWQLVSASGLSMHTFGFHFLTGANWDENADSFHALPFIFGTLYSAAIALLLAVPISIGSAIFLSELSPRWIRTPATFLIELLAAIPSVVYGLWGIFIMLPWLAAHVMMPISRLRLPAFHWHLVQSHLLPAVDMTRIPIGETRGIGVLFSGSPAGGYSMLAAGVILAIMVTPFITAVTRDILRAIPRSQREGSYALGATQWETISRVVTPYAKSGIIGAVILGLGRALGETMAVTMVIGNGNPDMTKHPSGIDWSLFDPANTMASVLANKYNEASPGSLNASALVEIGLVLFCVTIVVNIIARLLVFYTAKDVQGKK